MAQLSIAELLNDPDFSTACNLIRRASSVNQYGELVLTETTTPIYAVLQPSSAGDLELLPESARGRENFAVFYKGILSTLTANGYADIIGYNGNRYAVSAVEAWSCWGAGWTRAVCVREETEE